MARPRVRIPPVLIPAAVLVGACVLALALPFRMIEPDDDDFFYGMHAFARGKVVMTAAEVQELRKIPLPDGQKVVGPGSAEAVANSAPLGEMMRAVRDRSLSVRVAVAPARATAAGVCLAPSTSTASPASISA